MNTLRTTMIAAALVLGAALSTAFLACKDCEKGAGNTEKRTLDIEELDGIVLQGSMNVKLTRSATRSVVVEAQPNLIDLLETKVGNGTWTIRTNKCYTSDKPFTVHVAVPTIGRVTVQGSGSVTSDDVFETDGFDLSVQGNGGIRMGMKARSVDVKVQGSGNVTLKGACEELSGSTAGSGDIRAGDLRVSNAKAVVTGSGDVTVRVSGTLSAAITGSGDVRYKGSPARIERQVIGSGQVKPAE